MSIGIKTLTTKIMIDIITNLASGRVLDMSDTYLTVPTRLVESQSDRFARRRWSNTSSGQHTVLFAQYFHGGMDHLNPPLTDGVAESHRFILYNGRGVASSTRNARNHIEDGADDIALVIRTLGLLQVDLLARYRRLPNAGGHPASSATCLGAPSPQNRPAWWLPEEGAQGPASWNLPPILGRQRKTSCIYSSVARRPAGLAF